MASIQALEGARASRWFLDPFFRPTGVCDASCASVFGANQLWVNFKFLSHFDWAQACTDTRWAPKGRFAYRGAFGLPCRVLLVFVISESL